MIQASFIVPALDEEKYIQSCLSSIVDQESYVDFEIIVVDGGSTDNTAKLAEKYADRVLKTDHRGVWLSRNRGAAKAKGQTLLFIDADTILPRNYLEVAHAILCDEEMSGLSCAFKFDRRSRSLKMIEDIANDYLLAKSLVGQGELLGFNAAMSRADFHKVGGFPNAPLEDGAMAKKLRKEGKLVYLPEPKVTTSSRRLRAGGVVSAIVYYASLGLITDFPRSPIRRLMRYRDYVPVR